MTIQQAIKLNDRKYQLNIPKIIMVGMDWGEDDIEIEPDPIDNRLILFNKYRKPVGFTQFFLNINNAKWIRNKKKYVKEINNNLSKEDKEIKYGTNWDEVEDGGYNIIKLEHDEIKSEEKKLHDFPKELKEPYKQVLQARKSYLMVYLNYLVDKGNRIPKWFEKLKFQIENNI